jgi:outer membrane protein
MAAMKPMAVLLFALLAFAGATIPLPAAAQQTGVAGLPKIGYVNTNLVMRDSQASKQAQKDLEAEYKRREAEILKGPPNQVDRRRAALEEDIAVKRDEALKRLVDRANVEIKRMAEAENFDLVVFEATFASPRVDLTARVIKALDAKK